MEKEELKEFLESYLYDEQYLKEKIKELEKIKNRSERIFEESVEDVTFVTVGQNEKQIVLEIYLKKQKIENLFQQLQQPYKTLMYLKYINFCSFDQVADKMNYSTKRIYQLHNEALQMILKNIEKDNLKISAN